MNPDAPAPRRFERVHRSRRSSCRPQPRRPTCPWPFVPEPWRRTACVEADAPPPATCARPSLPAPQRRPPTTEPAPTPRPARPSRPRRPTLTNGPLHAVRTPADRIERAAIERGDRSGSPSRVARPPRCASTGPPRTRDGARSRSEGGGPAPPAGMARVVPLFGPPPGHSARAEARHPGRAGLGLGVGAAARASAGRTLFRGAASRDHPAHPRETPAR